MNQRHEVAVCLDPHRGLAASASPWQAGRGPCQTCSPGSGVDLPLRPAAGLPAVRISVLTPCGFCCCFFPHLSPGGGVAGGVSQPRPLWRHKAQGTVSWHAVTAAAPGGQEPKGGRVWQRDHPRGTLSLLGTGSEGEGRSVGRERPTQGQLRGSRCSFKIAKWNVRKSSFQAGRVWNDLNDQTFVVIPNLLRAFRVPR